MKIKDLERVPKHMTSIGGQAVIEGVMMRGPKDLAVAIRKPDGEIEIKKEKLNTLAMRNKFFGLPFIRGVVGLVESLIMGMDILTYSASFMEDEEEYEEGFLDRILNKFSEDTQMIITVITAIFMSVVLFMLIPTIITNIFKNLVNSPIALNLIEGLVRMIIFTIYLISVSRMEEISRVFEYHGAEHKTIHCYENGDELTVENARKYPGLHPRCGTSFLFMVMIISILLLSFFGWPNPLQRIINRLLMFPIIAGVAYEVNRLIGRSGSKIAYYLSYPGLMIQKFATIKEPDDLQLEVAIESLKAVLTESEDDDKW